MSAIAPALPPDLPWYRHRWPWILFSGPAIVVVAAVVSMLLAIRSDDGLVAQDYYKRGLLINRELGKTERAAAMSAVVALARDGMVRVTVAGGLPERSGVLRLMLVHPTREGFDRTITLAPAADGTYAARLGTVGPGRWLVTVESDTWRFPTVEVTAPFDTVRLGTAASDH